MSQKEDDLQKDITQILQALQQNPEISNSLGNAQQQRNRTNREYHLDQAANAAGPDNINTLANIFTKLGVDPDKVERERQKALHRLNPQHQINPQYQSNSYSQNRPSYQNQPRQTKKEEDKIYHDQDDVKHSEDNSNKNSQILRDNRLKYLKMHGMINNNKNKPKPPLTPSYSTHTEKSKTNKLKNDLNSHNKWIKYSSRKNYKNKPKL